MRPFFNYFGGKWRSSVRYPGPQHEIIVEPFAGAAGFSVRRSGNRKVFLYDKSPIIIGIWDYLIHANKKRILALPDIEFGTMVADPKYKLCQEEAWLIGFWMNTGVANVCRQPSAWYDPDKDPSQAKFLWGQRIRKRIASQLQFIRHWKAEVCSYEDIPNRSACWFIDPPYQDHGKWYTYNNKTIDFKHLGEWCLSRQGQYIVCEGKGADWLPFKPFGEVQAKYHPGKITEDREKATTCHEVIFTNTPLPVQVSLF